MDDTFFDVKHVGFLGCRKLLSNPCPTAPDQEYLISVDLDRCREERWKVAARVLQRYDLPLPKISLNLHPLDAHLIPALLINTPKAPQPRGRKHHTRGGPGLVEIPHHLPLVLPGAVYLGYTQAGLGSAAANRYNHFIFRDVAKRHAILRDLHRSHANKLRILEHVFIASAARLPVAYPAHDVDAVFWGDCYRFGCQEIAFELIGRNP